MTKNKSDITVSEMLYENVRRIIEEARKKVYRTVNFAMVEAYWNIGILIVENEQKGKKRAEYGTALIKKLSGKLSSEFGKGYDATYIKRMRQFYLIFPPIKNSSPNKAKSAALRHQLPSPMLNA
ncbi:MAG: DUF1016 domain-containing protein [bacterium]|nr:DUF1016 domain-containing protein [bacterium]